MSKYGKTYQIGSPEAMRHEPSLVSDEYWMGPQPDCTCEHGHSNCALEDKGECWKDLALQLEMQLDQLIHDTLMDDQFNDFCSNQLVEETRR